MRSVSGSKVTVTIKFLGATIAEVDDKYSIKDGKTTFDFESDDENKDEVNYHPSFIRTGGKLVGQ